VKGQRLEPRIPGARAGRRRPRGGRLQVLLGGRQLPRASGIERGYLPQRHTAHKWTSRRGGRGRRHRRRRRRCRRSDCLYPWCAATGRRRRALGRRRTSRSTHGGAQWRGCSRGRRRQEGAARRREQRGCDAAAAVGRRGRGDDPRAAQAAAARRCRPHNEAGKGSGLTVRQGSGCWRHSQRCAPPEGRLGLCGGWCGAAYRHGELAPVAARARQQRRRRRPQPVEDGVVSAHRALDHGLGGTRRRACGTARWRAGR